MKNRKRNRLFLFLILIVGVTIGFAALSTTLKINGISRVKKASWNIHWDNVDNEKGVTATTPAYIKDNKKQIVEYEVFFTEPGQYYEFTVDAVNDGTLDGKISKIESKVNGQDLSTLPPYVKYSVKYLDGTEPALNDELDTGETQTYKIHVEYDRDAVTNAIVNNMADNETYVFTYEVTYSQKIHEHVKAPVSFPRDDWDTIAKYGNEAAKQKTTNNYECGAYRVGESKVILMDMDDNGEDEEYRIRISNCSTPDICNTEGFSQTACGFVLEFIAIPARHKMNTSVYNNGYGTNIGENAYGGWEYSDMRAYLNGNTYAYDGTNYANNGFINKLPEELKNKLADTTVVSGYYAYDETNGGSNYVTTDKLYLLAPHEVYEDNLEYNIKLYDKSYNSTRQLDYYTMQNVQTIAGSGTSRYSEKWYATNLEGNAQRWWLRSVNYDYPDGFYYVNENGNNQSHVFNVETNIGVSPAFKLK